MDTKVCVVCNKTFPATPEYFVVDKRNPNGVGGRCRPCSRIKAKESHERCKDHCKAWREANKEHIKEKKHNDYLKNKEKRSARGKANYENNKERYAETMKKWKANNRDRVNELSRQRYQRVKEHHAEITKRWKQEHKEERNIHYQNRRAREKNLEYSLTPNQWEAIKIEFNNKCAYCGKEAKLTQDHFVPLESNGEYSVNNIVPACGSCNSSKSTKSFFDWYPNYQHYSKRREQRILKFLGYSGKFQQLSLAEAKFVS